MKNNSYAKLVSFILCGVLVLAFSQLLLLILHSHIRQMVKNMFIPIVQKECLMRLDLL